MAHLIFRCDRTEFVIMTGLEIEPLVFKRLQTTRLMPCRYCRREHAWAIVERIPPAAMLMSRAAKDCLRRSLQSDANAARAVDDDVRALYERMARRWFQLAVARDQLVEPASGFIAFDSLFDEGQRPRGP